VVLAWVCKLIEVPFCCPLTGFQYGSKTMIMQILYAT